jgi:hypothetical protein
MSAGDQPKLLRGWYVVVETTKQDSVGARTWQFGYLSDIHLKRLITGGHCLLHLLLYTTVYTFVTKKKGYTSTGPPDTAYMYLVRDVVSDRHRIWNIPHAIETVLALQIKTYKIPLGFIYIRISEN